MLVRQRERLTKDLITSELSLVLGQGLLTNEGDDWKRQRRLIAPSFTPRHLAVIVERAHRHGLTVTGHVDSGRRGSVNPKDAIELGIDRVEHFLGGDQLPPSRSAYASLVEVDVTDVVVGCGVRGRMKLRPRAGGSCDRLVYCVPCPFGGEVVVGAVDGVADAGVAVVGGALVGGVPVVGLAAAGLVAG